MSYLDELRNVIRRIHETDSAHVATVPVTATAQDQVVWEGLVEVFDLKDHPTAFRAYAWAHKTYDSDMPTRHVAVLHLHPVKSAADAVKAVISEESKYLEQA